MPFSYTEGETQVPVGGARSHKAGPACVQACAEPWPSLEQGAAAQSQLQESFSQAEPARLHIKSYSLSDPAV